MIAGRRGRSGPAGTSLPEMPDAGPCIGQVREDLPAGDEVLPRACAPSDGQEAARPQECPDRVADVVMHVARSPDVLHQVPSVRLQCAMDPFQDLQRPCLVVHGVERRDEIVLPGLRGRVETGRIADKELDVPQTLLRCLGARLADRLLRKVDSGEAAVGVLTGRPDGS